MIVWLNVICLVVVTAPTAVFYVGCGAFLILNCLLLGYLGR